MDKVDWGQLTSVFTIAVLWPLKRQSVNLKTDHPNISEWTIESNIFSAFYSIFGER